MPPFQPFPFNEFAAIVGGHNWVVARRSPRVVAKYGDDVVCLSPKRYAEVECIARKIAGSADAP